MCMRVSTTYARARVCVCVCSTMRTSTGARTPSRPRSRPWKLRSWPSCGDGKRSDAWCEGSAAAVAQVAPAARMAAQVVASPPPPPPPPQRRHGRLASWAISWRKWRAPRNGSITSSSSRGHLQRHLQHLPSTGSSRTCGGKRPRCWAAAVRQQCRVRSSSSSVSNYRQVSRRRRRRSNAPCSHLV